MASRGVVPIKPGCGGAELVVLNLAKSLARSGHQVTLVADTAGGLIDPVGGLRVVPVRNRWIAAVERLPSGLFGFLGWLAQHLVGNVAVAAKVKQLLRADGPYDVVHMHGNLSTVLIARSCSIPLVYTEHDATPWRCRYRSRCEHLIRKLIYAVVNGLAFRVADKVVAIFDEQVDDIGNGWKVQNKISLIRNGTDIDIFRPVKPGISRIKKDYGFERYCLFVGGLTARKSPDLLLRAVAECESLACVIAGDGPMRRKLIRQAQVLGIGDRVAFLGNVRPSELGQIYAEADMLVLPSVSEASPLVVLEAMACGIPVLASKAGGLPNLVKDWETGFLTKPGDVGQLVMGMRFLSGDANLRQRMGENGRNRVLSAFPWEQIAGEYTALYRSLGGVEERSDVIVLDEPVDVTVTTAEESTLRSAS
jgi:glycosyltransferase involved in cell wall biosynthesis